MQVAVGVDTRDIVFVSVAVFVDVGVYVPVNVIVAVKVTLTVTDAVGVKVTV